MFQNFLLECLLLLLEVVIMNRLLEILLDVMDSCAEEIMNANDSDLFGNRRMR